MQIIQTDNKSKFDIHKQLYGGSDQLSFTALLLMQKNQADLYARHQDEITAYMAAHNLSDEYARAQQVFSGEIGLNEDLVKVLEAEEIDFNALAEAGFQDLKDIEHARPDLIVKLQTQLEKQGLYVSDENHRYYRDGKLGSEASSVTWNGVKLASDRGLEYAQESLAENFTANRLTTADRMKMQQAFNRQNVKDGDEDMLPINGVSDLALAQQVYDQLSTDPNALAAAGYGVMRIMNRALERDVLDSLVSHNDHATQALAYARENPQTESNFDYEAGSASARTLLDFIGHHESRNRNVIYDGGDGTEVDLANMTLNEVLAYQDRHVAAGYASSAISPLQFVRGTLRETIASVPDISGNDRMTDGVIERLGMELLDKRGLGDYLNGGMSTERFILSLSKEWASLPKDAGGKSYYAGDGLNAAHAEYAELHTILEDMRDNYRQQMQPGLQASPIMVASSTPADPPSLRARFESALEARIPFPTPRPDIELPEAGAPVPAARPKV